MKVAYFHVGEDVPMDYNPEAAVVIDVLRATTTITCALNNGADSVEVYADINELKSNASKIPEDMRLLIGERGGKKLEGFDLGNSPVAVTPEIVKGKKIFMSTTNGTRALHKVRDSEYLYTMSLSNRKAVGIRLLQDQPQELWILGSGWEGAYSLEDSLAAGALASFLLENSPGEIQIENDELIASLALWDKWNSDCETCLRTASHGKRLINLGNHDEDFRCCSELDNLSVVPFQTKPGVIQAG